MMDFGPLLASPDPFSAARDLHKTFPPLFTRESATMIIDDSNHSSMPVSPKQGETIMPDNLTKQDSQMVPSSLTPTSWDNLSSQPKSSPSLSSSASQITPSWISAAPRTSSPLVQAKTVREALEMVESQADPTRAENNFNAWNSGKAHNSSANSSPISASFNNLQSPLRKELEDNEDGELPSLAMSSAKMNARNCDRPDSSLSPQSQLNSSFDESEPTGNEVSLPSGDAFCGNNGNIYAGSFERRSRRKPINGDVIRRVRPPMDALPYDSEESEIEDDILRDELMAVKMEREHQHDEVDGIARSNFRLAGEPDFRDSPRHYKVDRLSKIEAVDGILEEDDEDDMDLHSESDSIGESDKHAYLKDIPVTIFNYMDELKVSAHNMFMKTSNLPPTEAKVRREPYLLQLLSNLRDRCLEEGLKPDVIVAILKDVETEFSYLSEYLEEEKAKQSLQDSEKQPNHQGNARSDAHFLTRPDIKSEDDQDKKFSLESDSLFSNPPSFFSKHCSDSPPSPAPTSTSSPSSNTKPIIVTVSADMKMQPPNTYARGGLPPHPSLLPDPAFGPMFPNGKFGFGFPPGLVNSIYGFNSPGSLDYLSGRKFMNLEGKIGENVDKDYLKCQFCERTFRRQKNLENHVENTHQGKGPLKPRRETNDMYFKCSHCPYTTKHQSNLYVHLRIHTGERPYICGACGVQYSQSHSLKSHIINKHDGCMSYYIKEKRTRSPRGMGYLSAQVMHDSNLFKLPGPLLGSPLHHNNLDIVSKALEFATSETAKHQQQMKQQQQQQQQQTGSHFSPSGVDGNNPRAIMPPLAAFMSGNDGPNLGTVNGNLMGNKNVSPNSVGNGQGGDHKSSTPSNSLFGPVNGGPHPPPFFMNGHPLLFGELPPHLRHPNHLGNGHHPPSHHPFLPGFPHFPPNGYHNHNLSPLSGLSPNSSPAASTPNSHHNLPPHLQPHLHMPVSHLPPASPVPLLQHHQIKAEPPVTPATPLSSSKPIPRNQSDEAMDLRKKSPPPDSKDAHSHDLNSCSGKENCPHAAKLKYLRLNVVRMLGILVPNLNFAEKGISAESESVDELLQDVIESNTHEDDME